MRRIIGLSLIAGLFLASNYIALAAPDAAKVDAKKSSPIRMSDEDVVKFIDSDKLEILKTKAAVPEAVIKQFGRISDPGGPFSGGCTGPDPHSRMILAARQANLVLFCYESGGFAYYRKATIYKIEGQSAIKVFDAFADFTDLESLRKALHSGAIRNTVQ